VAVDGLDLEVPECGVFGFLGPNGAGKTTTIRCLLGLVSPSAGSMGIMGRPMPSDLPAVVREVGAIVETPLSDAALTIVRVAAVAGGFALIGGAVAMIGRHTAAALGAVFVYMAVLESIVRGLKHAMGRFLLGDNLGTVVTGETAALSQGGQVFQLTPGRGVLVIAAYVVVLVGIALVVLRVRDVN
jgi:ABC-type branched-subunit amino acid transport system ATPase component